MAMKLVVGRALWRMRRLSPKQILVEPGLFFNYWALSLANGLMAILPTAHSESAATHGLSTCWVLNKTFMGFHFCFMGPQ